MCSFLLAILFPKLDLILSDTTTALILGAEHLIPRGFDTEVLVCLCDFSFFFDFQLQHTIFSDLIASKQLFFLSGPTHKNQFLPFILIYFQSIFCSGVVRTFTLTLHLDF